MKISGIIWLASIVEKLYKKHSVAQEEVAEIFQSRPKIRFVESGLHEDEDVYAAMGRTSAGRYLIVFFVRKKTGQALIISARDMTPGEKKRYEKK